MVVASLYFCGGISAFAIRNIGSARSRGRGVAPPGHFGRIEVRQGPADALGHADSGGNHQFHRLAPPHHTYAGVRPGCTGNRLHGPRDVDFRLWHWGFAGFNGLASVPNLKHIGILLVLAVVLWHLSMVVFSASTSLYLSLAILLFTERSFLDPGFDADPPAQDDPSGVQRAGAGDAFFCHLRLHLRSLNSGAVAGIWGAPWAANMNAVIGITMVGVLALVAPKFRRS